MKGALGSPVKASSSLFVSLIALILTGRLSASYSSEPTRCEGFDNATEQLVGRFEAVILNKLPILIDLIDTSRQDITKDKAFSQAKVISHGLSMALGWNLNTISTYISTNGALGELNLYLYGLIIIDGIADQKSTYLGGKPNPDDSRNCFTTKDFHRITDQFGGIQIPSCQKVLSRLSDYELILRAKMNCLLQEASIDSAGELAWTLEEFLAAVKFRNELIDQSISKNKANAR